MKITHIHIRSSTPNYTPDCYYNIEFIFDSNIHFVNTHLYKVVGTKLNTDNIHSLSFDRFMAPYYLFDYQYIETGICYPLYQLIADYIKLNMDTKVIHSIDFILSVEPKLKLYVL